MKDQISTNERGRSRNNKQKLQQLSNALAKSQQMLSTANQISGDSNRISYNTGSQKNNLAQMVPNSQRSPKHLPNF